MKAWRLYDIGDIRYEETDQPVPSDGEVLVRVGAVGVCGSDIPRIYRDGAHRMPLIPGHEFSGEVVRAKDASGQEWVGKRVGIFPLIPCRDCIACRKRRYEMCRNYSYLGSRQDGGFAEYVKVPVSNLISLPEEVTYEQAAMLEPMAVAVHAIRRVEIMPESRVVVCGLGTIGLLIVLFLLERGLENIYVIGNKEFQKKTILSMGLPESHYCDGEEIMKKGITDAEIVFECVGKPATINLALDLAAPAGSVCLVGNPHSDIMLERAIYWKILRNQLFVTGTWNSSFQLNDELADDEVNKKECSDWQYVVDLLQRKRIQPEKLITHHLPMQDLEQGLQIMRDKTENYIKVMSVYID